MDVEYFVYPVKSSQVLIKTKLFAIWMDHGLTAVIEIEKKHCIIIVSSIVRDVCDEL